MYRSVVKQRLFIGWPLGPTDRERMAGHVAAYRRLSGLGPVRWLEPDSWHLTLRFVGETQRGKELSEALGQALARQRQARLAFRTLGPFPAGRPSVLAFQGPLSDSLSALGACVEDAVDSLGLSPQRRPLKPHLSIARVKYWHAGPWPSLDTDLDFRIDRVALFRSETLPRGAQYTVLRQWRLAGPTSVVG